MSIVNKVFLDSSILIEYLKGNKVELLRELLASPYIDLYISDTVCSEVLFYYLAIKAEKSPLAIKESHQIATYLDDNKALEFLSLFQSISLQDKYIELFIQLMSKHNLLPNDALLLSTCLQNEIKFLATYDKDLISSTKTEGIHSLSKIEDLKTLNM
ncbi:MAG: PIN domain-containing protein [Chitinophagales bacterium]|nr:PIN domain-containing protein [Chitinophagales bacterium]